jgi:hypothetical protein
MKLKLKEPNEAVKSTDIIASPSPDEDAEA